LVLLLFAGINGQAIENEMVALQRIPTVRAEIVSDPSVMSGDPVIRGTRVLAESVIAYLRAGYTHKQIFEDFPTLPVDGIDAVIAWAEEQFGRDWMEQSDPFAQ
jgi:uncharacterized protein (DUF433 family)